MKNELRKVKALIEKGIYKDVIRGLWVICQNLDERLKSVERQIGRRP